MKSLLIEGTKLNFIESNADKTETLLFIHGNSHSLKTFSKQFSSPFLKEYHLIAIDLPGHGDSSKNGNYSVKNFAHLIYQLILALDLKNIIIVGHSLGGHVAINLLKHYNPKGLFIFGTPPLKNPFDPNAFLPNNNVKALGQKESTEPEIENLMREMNYRDEDMKLAIADYLRTDPVFRTEILTDIFTSSHEHEVALINSFQAPIMFLLATTDGLINNRYIRNEFQAEHNKMLVEIKAGHSAHIEVSEAFNECLSSFAREVFDTKLENKINDNSLQHESHL